MDEQKFKTDVAQSIKLKVAEPEVPTGESIQSGSEIAAELPTPVNASSIAESVHVAAPRKSHRSPMEILADPHASEEEWLQAHQQLELQKSEIDPDTGKRSRSRRRKFRLLTALLVASAAAGAYFYQTHNQTTPPAPAPVPAPAPAAKAILPDKGPVDFGPYMTELQHQIKSHWKPPKGFADSKIGLHFKVHTNGEITDIGFDRLSHNPEADAAAIRSLLETMPTAPPLPPGSPESVDVQFTFDSHVFKSSDAKTHEQ